MPESIFRSQDGLLIASEHARGPWDANALHGGAPAALIASAFERMPSQNDLRVARLGFELLRPIPFEPLTLSTRVVREGRRVQELAAELRAGELLICRASALRVREVPAGLPCSAPEESAPPAAAGLGEAAMRGPEDATPLPFALNDDEPSASFATSAMQMRWIDDPRQLGPARVWMRLARPLLDGKRATPLASMAATADFGNGASATLPFERFVFINADLSIHLHRQPRGEWTGLDARTLLTPGGTGLAECVLHDQQGPIGRSFQTLVVEAR
ncbi:MAG TPA: thioesterase family protein [Solirubrobacteraceae bacterium]|nr:thioesterase family protein [Solirubrobacteraceae bacterium]